MYGGRVGEGMEMGARGGNAEGRRESRCGEFVTGWKRARAERGGGRTYEGGEASGTGGNKERGAGEREPLAQEWVGEYRKCVSANRQDLDFLFCFFIFQAIFIGIRNILKSC